MHNQSNKNTAFDNLRKTKVQWLQEGIEFYNSKRYREAITAFEQAILLDPNYARAYHEKGLVLEAINHRKGAVIAYKYAIELNPLKVRTYCDLGRVLYEMRHYRASGIVYRQAIQINSDVSKQYSDLTTKIVDEGKAIRALENPFVYDVESTLQSCEDAILFNPTSAYAYAEKGRVLFVNLSYKDAGNAYKKAVQLDSAYNKIYIGFQQKLLDEGIVCYEKRAYKEAVEAYTKVVFFEPYNIEAYIGQTKAYYALQYYREAGVACRQAVLLDTSVTELYTSLATTLITSSYEYALMFDPNNAFAYIKKAEVLYMSMEFEESGKAYRSAIQLDTTYSERYEEWLNNILIVGKDAYQQQKYRDSLPYFKRAIEFNPYDPRSYTERGKTLYALEHYKEARESFERAIQIDSTSEKIYVDTGNVLSDEIKTLCESGKYKDAYDRQKHLILFDPKRINILDQQARSFLVQGIEFFKQEKFDEALASLDNAIACNPDDADSYIEKGKVFYTLEKYKDARIAYTEAMRLDVRKAELYKAQGIGLVDKAKALYLLRDYEKACLVYGQAAIFYPMNAEILACYGNILYQLSNFKQAYDAYKQAMHLNGRYTYDFAVKSDSLLHKAQRLYDHAQYKEAYMAFEQAIFFNPDVASIYIKKAYILYEREKQLYTASNQNEQISYVYQQTILFASGTIWNYFNYGKILSGLKRYEEALKAFTLVIELGEKTEEVIKEQRKVKEEAIKEQYRASERLRLAHKRLGYL